MGTDRTLRCPDISGKQAAGWASRPRMPWQDIHSRIEGPAARDVSLVQARSAYERALTLDPALAEAHRQLGLLYYAMRDFERARGELERYLALAPSAPDRARIGEYIMELAR